MSRSFHIFVFCLAVLVLTCDSPNDPDPTPPQDYIVYALIPDNDFNCFRFHTLTKEIDSVTLPLPQTQIGFGLMAVSPDGQKLYVASGWVAVVNASTLALEKQVDRQDIEKVVTSPDGQYLALLGDSLRLWRADDYSEVAVYPIDAWDAEFSGDATMLYFMGYLDTLRYVYLNDPMVVHTASGSGRLRGDLAVSNDGSKTFIYFENFTVYDLALDSVVFQEWIFKGTGEVDLSPDGRRAYISSPGYREGTPADYTWKVFDITLNAFVDSITVPTDCNLDGLERIGEFELTPDGRLAIGIEGNVDLNVRGYDIAAYNLKTGRKDFIKCLPQTRISLACQAKLIE